MIDLHTHTTASDGRCSPDELAVRAHTAGVTTLGVTDHDTLGGCAEAAAACARLGLTLVPGIEITAVTGERDVHVLAYFVDPQSESLRGFLAAQRRLRLERVREMIARLAQHGLALDADTILAPGVTDSSRAAGRPWIARALVDAGYVTTKSEAFQKWLTPGRPGFVPRRGASPADVFAHVHEAGGLASLAHPVLNKHDDWIQGFAQAGLDAIEAFHSDHDGYDTARYLAFAQQFNLLVTGGSDYHGDEDHGGRGPGSVSLPREHFERLRARAGR